MEIKQKILFLALIIFSFNAYSMKNELVCIDYSGSLQFVNESKGKDMIIGTINIIDKWEYKILKSKWMDKEHRLMKIIIRARLIKFFEQKEVISNYVFNVSTRQIIYEEEFSNGINMIIIGGDKSIYKEDYSQKWYEILTTRITKCLGDYYYYERGDLYRCKCGESRKPRLDEKVLQKPVNPNNDDKFINWGFRHVVNSLDYSCLLVTFTKETNHFYFNRKTSISEIIEYNIATKKSTRVSDFADNPSYSPNGDYILYESVYQSRGFRNIESQGFYIYNKKNGSSTFLRKCISAFFVE